MPHHPMASTLCNGPLGAPMVLPIVTCAANQHFAVVTTCTSLCDGATMHNSWFYHNNVIATQATSIPTAASWVFIPGDTLSTLTSSSFLGVPISALPLRGVLFVPPVPRVRVLPRVIRAGRRAVRRSIDLYVQFRGADEVRRFLRGEELVYRGQRYDYRVKKKLAILPQAMQPNDVHIPYTLKLADKVSGKALASGCVVFPSLPVFDQLLALSLHIQDPDEEGALIEATNWSPPLDRVTRVRRPAAHREAA